ncbi:uncharacterized protein K452DRAFT_301570 [Aplosporella prunicola CBS 121167]|uniref:Uncharacterized protein n=1 Tax=Aplosporella prunicola CBS 121167 TaxID=1176127 RepID=A0A6A6B1C6_9PEZI|nr:uncharacterized protein K452DRAFT_301570 [Aplosporella prunicola CBS 121167]KAF2137840.1 hypothetical protein K452DRAFT_301570 [Aplosporella prunicola CBS 121167]
MNGNQVNTTLINRTPPPRKGLNYYIAYYSLAIICYIVVTIGYLICVSEDPTFSDKMLTIVFSVSTLVVTIGVAFFTYASRRDCAYHLHTCRFRAKAATNNVKGAVKDFLIRCRFPTYKRPRAGSQNGAA